MVGAAETESKREEKRKGEEEMRGERGGDSGGVHESRTEAVMVVRNEGSREGREGEVRGKKGYNQVI